MQKVQISPSQNSLGGGALNSPKILVLRHFKGYLTAQNIGVSREYMPTQNTPVNAKYLPLQNFNINADFLSNNFQPNNHIINKNFASFNSPQNNINLIKPFSATPCAFLC